MRGASLYHHFASKEEILYAICLTVTEEPNEQNLPLLDAPGTPAQRLAALVRGHLHHLHRRRTEHIVGLHELAALTPEHRAVVDEHRRYYQRRVREVIAAGVAAGELTVPDPRLAAVALCDVLNGLSSWFRENGELSLDEVADDLRRPDRPPHARGGPDLITDRRRPAPAAPRRRGPAAHRAPGRRTGRTRCSWGWPGTAG